METCHTSDKGKGRGSPALANSPAPRPQSSKKGCSSTTAQAQKKHRVSLYYTKYKSSSTAASGAVTVEEEREDLIPNPPLTPDPEICNNNNNEPAFISQLDKKATAHFKEDPQSTMEDKVPAAVMFPMETPAGFPDNVTVGPGPRPGLLVCSPAEKNCADSYTEKRDTEKRDISEPEVKKLSHFTSLIWWFIDKHDLLGESNNW